MKRILLDENLPIKLVELAPADCEPRHVVGLGWAHMIDAVLLEKAEAAGFEVFLTADQGIAFQQNFQARRIALVVLSTNSWPVIRDHVSIIFEAASKAEGGGLEIVALPWPTRSRGR